MGGGYLSKSGSKKEKEKEASVPFASEKYQQTPSSFCDDGSLNPPFSPKSNHSPLSTRKGRFTPLWNEKKGNETHERGTNEKKERRDHDEFDWTRLLSVSFRFAVF